MPSWATGTAAKLIGAAVVLLALMGGAIYIINNLEDAGAAKVEVGVAKTTATAIEGAVKEKAKVDEKVRTSDPDTVIDLTR